MRQMKDSGIEWIGQIPQEWDVRRVKFTLDDHSGGSWGSNEGESETDCICVRVADFNYPTLSVDFHDNMTKRSYAEKAIAESSLKSGDILLEKSGGGDVTPVGRSVLFENDESMMCANFIEWLRPNYNYDSRFLNYWLAAAYVNGFSKRNVKQTTGIQNLDVTAFLSERIAAPTRKMQLIIANYLDAKCAEIDALIEAKEKTNALLRERRQSTIYEAVTKGLNPDVPMKDSGIEWIGMIPKDWVVGKTIYGLEMPITDGPHETPQLYSEGVPFISAEAVSCGNGNIDFNHIRGYISEEYYAECCKKYIPRINDIYMIKSGATTGKVAIVDTDRKFTIWSPLAVFRCAEHKCHYKYLYYFLQSDAYQKQVEASWSFGTQQNIGMRTLERLLICFPGVNEQKEIADYLDACCSETDLMIAANEATIQKLKEYRQSIIFEAVTGKIEV